MFVRVHGVLPVLAVLLLSGCGGSGDQLSNLSGKATFAGKPIAFGQIEFIPDAGKDHKGPAGSAEIVDGAFDTSRGGQGIVPGPHEVRITAYEERPAPANPDETVPSTSKPPLFVGYVLREDLKAGNKDFDVPESARGFDPFKGAGQVGQPGPGAP